MTEELLKEYQKKMVSFCIAIFTISATAAAIVFPLLKIFNLYPAVSWAVIGIFEAVVIIEDICGIVLFKKTKKEKYPSVRNERFVKILLITIQGLNLILITCFFPSKESWMFSLYFIIIIMLFLDITMMKWTIIIDSISLLALFIFNPASRPVDSLYISDFILRAICIILSFTAAMLVIIFIHKFLLNAKKSR